MPIDTAKTARQRFGELAESVATFKKSIPHACKDVIRRRHFQK